jgi:hypothetical protein
MTRPPWMLPLGLLSAAMPSACSSDHEDEPFNDVAVTGATNNPDGQAYPTEHLGGQPRAGSYRGARIPNFSFQAYPDSNIAGGLKTISLADYYDPGQKRAKVLHLMVAAVWCPICDGMTREMLPLKTELANRDVVIVQVLMDGKRYGIAPSLNDVASWINRFPTWYTVGIDAHAQRIGTIAQLDGLPWNAFVDLRTMEILLVVPGRPISYEQTIDQLVEWVNTHPPSY